MQVPTWLRHRGFVLQIQGPLYDVSSYFDHTSLTMDYTLLPNLFCNVSGGSNLVRRGSCDSSSDSEHVSGAETYVSFTGGPHKHSNPDIVKGVSFKITLSSYSAQDKFG